MEENVIKQFTNEEVAEIKDLQKQVVTTISKVGEVELNIQDLEANYKALKNEKNSLISEYGNLRVKETELGKRLREKYGEGTYDITTNQFTPIQ
jgi:regulator of replication initiation timing